MRLKTRSSYPIGIMAGLCTSLACVGILFNIPVGSPPERSGWRLPSGSQDRIGLIDLSQRLEAQHFGAPASEAAMPNPTTDAVPTADPVALAENTPTDVEAPQSTAEMHSIQSLEILDVAELMPDIQGGIGAYYINIEYPQKAVNDGVEGRLVLHFVVEPNGSTSNVRIHKSVHPLLDSAAVRALRRTAFIPGTQNGQPVRVRMSLPCYSRLWTLPKQTPPAPDECSKQE